VLTVQADTLPQEFDPLGLQHAAQVLELRQVSRVVQAWPGRWRGFSVLPGVQRINGLVPESTDAIPNEIGTHHPLYQARLPCLVNHVATVRRLEIRRHALQQGRHVQDFFLTATLGVPHPQLRRIRDGLDPPYAYATVAAMLFEYPRSRAQPYG